jgi:hypothetical protein
VIGVVDADRAATDAFARQYIGIDRYVTGVATMAT